MNFEQPTPEPSVSWLLEAGVAGMKPHITMLSSASVSVLAEGDVFLPCKAAGNPRPNISWTKVSTGKIKVNERLWICLDAVLEREALKYILALYLEAAVG